MQDLRGVTTLDSINGANGSNGHHRVEVSPRGDILLDRPLPTNTDAERHVLGVILLDNSIFAEVVAALKQGDAIFSMTNRAIYRAMVRLADAGHVIDPLSLRDELTRDGQLERCGGPAYIASLWDGVPRFSNVDSYIRLINEKSAERELVRAGAEITATGLDPETPVSEKIMRAQLLIARIEDPNTRIRWRSAAELATAHMAKAEDFHASGRLFTGMPTGLHEIDALTDGLQKTDFIVIAGRPSMGKSALLACLALGAAQHKLNDNPVIAYFTLEMSEDQLTNRLLAILSGVDARRVRQGRLDRDEWVRVAHAQSTLDGLRVFIDDESGITPNQIRIKCRDLLRAVGRLDLVVVDYVQAMNADRPVGDPVKDTTAISKELKKIAKNDFGMPLIAAASLNRMAESRGNKRPSMGDLRESGQLESDADVIGLIYRDDFYNPQSEKANIAEVNFQKQRNGATGGVELVFRRELAKFDNLHRG